MDRQRHDNALTSKFPPHDVDQQAQGGLAGRVPADPGPRPPGRLGADVHDVSGALGAHGRQHRLGHGQHPDHVQVQDPGEILVIEPVQRQMEAGPGIVNERVNPAMTRHGGRHDTADVAAVGHIGQDRQRSPELIAEHGQAVSPTRREDRMSTSRIEQPRGCRPIPAAAAVTFTTTPASSLESRPAFVSRAPARRTGLLERTVHPAGGP
jgi:hypothetical protein